ncbi:polysaccharide export protein [Rhodocytophaga rosea]|uniref:Polysaccharide export protein n=1 Tax=Rhodocytophaga rosea TaxID=2704465 RepID=A0A6C0GD86_9BACT|nr:polysaccharide biosynthesis/export family protein [Rhodocytophaga rosea]QHT65773.1 polysaccharide export protein [Rhodocytophaga rosea]
MVSIRILFFCLLIFSIASCISGKKLVNLQDNEADIINSGKEVGKTFKLKDTEYHLRSGDRIMVRIFSLTQEKFNFFGAPEIELKLDKQGRVELPVLGYIQVGGLTIRETEEKLKELSIDYLKSPTISIKLTNFSFTILGEVNQQGTYTATEAKVNLLEALGRAGGLTDFADRANIRIIRHENETAKIFKLNVLEDNVLLSDQYFLQPNDIVMVDPLKAKNVRQNQMSTISVIVSVAASISLILFQILK